jgi:hypothetical protein
MMMRCASCTAGTLVLIELLTGPFQKPSLQVE